jgi:hypothetical protein
VGSREYRRFFAGRGSPWSALGSRAAERCGSADTIEEEVGAGTSCGLEVGQSSLRMWVTDKAVRKSATEAALRRTNAVCYEVL